MDDETPNRPSVDNDISEEENLDEEMDEMDADPSESKKHSPSINEEMMPTPSQDNDDTRHGMDDDEDDDESIPERPPSSRYVEYTGEESTTQSPSKGERLESTQSARPTSAPSRPDKICPVDSTLWMSDLKESWDPEFIKKAFESFGFIPINIKHITERVKVSLFLLQNSLKFIYYFIFLVKTICIC